MKPMPDSDTMHVHVVQPDIVWHDAQTNLLRVRSMLDARPPTPGSLVVLPEMFATGFTNDVDGQRDDGTQAAWLAQIASEYDCHVIGGLIELDPLSGLGLNQAVAVGPDGVELGRYAKNHRFPIGGEVDHYAAGEDVNALRLGETTVCPLVCFDLRWPETWRRVVGCDVYVLIANWPATRQHHWNALLRARAIENQAFVIGVNRVGSDPSVQYAGGSVVYDFDGHALLDLDERPGSAAATLDLKAMRAFRRKLPFLPASVRRPSLSRR